MAHFAEIDNENKVLRIVVISNDDILDENNNESEILGKTFCVNLYGGQWIQTSYSGKIRGKYAGIGDTYNEEEDIFISPKPFPSWIREGSYWKAPKDYPQDNKFYQWDENLGDWVRIGE